MTAMRGRRTVKLVSGYVRNVDWLDDSARDLDFQERFAVVMDTHEPGAMVFDHELFLALFEAVRTVLRHD
jgi:hypothetical protein